MVEDAIDEMPSGMALCIVHGMGTGRLRAAIHEHLKHDRQVPLAHALQMQPVTGPMALSGDNLHVLLLQVSHFSLDPASNGGCTQAFMR